MTLSPVELAVIIALAFAAGAWWAFPMGETTGKTEADARAGSHRRGHVLMAQHWNKPLIERLLEKVKITDQCWLFVTSINSEGYGTMFNGTSIENAHRIAYRLLCGPIENGLYVLHRCDVRNCIKPSHLFLGTNQDNMEDMIRKGRAVKARGTKNGSSKLSEKQIKEILLSSEPQDVLAKRFGISQSHVSQIQTRKIWKHI
jgi:HNH endonuclease